MIKIRGHHIDTIIYAIKTFKNPQTFIKEHIKINTKEYGKEYAINFFKILVGLFTEQELKIKIVAGLDNICEPCLAKKASCESAITSYDDKCTIEYYKKYGLKTNKIYKAREFLAIMKIANPNIDYYIKNFVQKIK